MQAPPTDRPRPRTQTDDALMAQMSGGDPSGANDSLAELERRYGARVEGFVHGLVRDDHLAQDVTQEVFEKLYLKNHLYRTGTNFRAWLFEIARNQALSALRTRRRQPRPVSSLAVVGADEDGDDLLDHVADHRVVRDLEERELMDAFADAVEGLPQRYREVFELCVRNGRSYQEAAVQLEIPTGTVAIRIMRARKRLFAELSRHVERIRRPPACFQ